MINSASISGINHGLKQQDVTANNIANIFSKEFEKSRAISKEAINGVETVIQKVDSLPLSVLNDNNELQKLSNVDINEETINSMTALTSIKANSKVLQTSNEMLGMIVDYLA